MNEDCIQLNNRCSSIRWLGCDNSSSHRVIINRNDLHLEFLVDKRPRQLRKRPVAVTIVAWTILIMFFVRLNQVFEPLIVTGVVEKGINEPMFSGFWFTPLGIALLTSLTYALLSLSGIVVLIGFLSMKKWSWVVLMVWTGISLIITLLDYFYGEANYIIMASDTIVAFALNQANVQRIFGIRTDPGERLD